MIRFVWEFDPHRGSGGEAGVSKGRKSQLWGTVEDLRVINRTDALILPQPKV